MSKALRLTKIDMQRAGQLAQQGCRSSRRICPRQPLGCC
jgi:hypothetical protein